MADPLIRASNPITVLVVEDHDESREAIAEYLTLVGLQVTTASDGQQAIDLARDLQPQVIVMDLAMPVLDGWEATRRLKAAADTKHIPVIALSAHAMTGDRDEALAAGCDDYDTKPIDFVRLFAKIDALLRHR